jgi:ABC-type transport system substrate-binding protein
VTTGNSHGHRSGAAFAIACLLLLMAAACGSGGESGGGGATEQTVGALVTVAPPGSPTPGGTLRFGLAAETDGWDPANSQWAGSGTTVSYAIFDRLAMNDREGNPRPFLAESIEPNDDFTRWTIKVRPGVLFHNNEKLDAEAIKKNLDRSRNSILLGPAFESITSVQIVDELTVQVTMSRPWSTFDSAMTSQAGVVAAPAQLDDPNGSRNPIGTGPFVFQEWIPDNRLVVVKNPNYWREGLPYLDKVEFRVIADNAARSAALEAGDIDALESTDDEQIAKLNRQAAEGRYQLFSNETAEDAPVQFVALNTAKPPFDDPLARQIVAYGLDTETLSATLYEGINPPARSLFPTTSPWYNPDSGYPRYDPERTRQLAAEYREKYGEPLRFTVNVPPLRQYTEIAETVQAQAREFDVEITINPLEQTQLIVDALTGNFQATGFVTFGDPNIDQVFISSRTLRPVGELSLNIARNDNPRLQEALDNAGSTDDPETQRQQWFVVQEEMANDLAFVFIVHQRSIAVFANSVFGFADATLPDGTPMLLTTSPVLTDVWLGT